MMLTRRQRRARNRRVILVVASILVLFAGTMAMVIDAMHVDMVPATVVSSCDGIVTMETADGQLWTCYGNTTATQVTAVFQSGACIDFEEK